MTTVGMSRRPAGRGQMAQQKLRVRWTWVVGGRTEEESRRKRLRRT